MVCLKSQLLGGQRQADFCETEAILVYIVSSRTAGTTQRNPVSKEEEKEEEEEEEEERKKTFFSLSLSHTHTHTERERESHIHISSS